MAMVIISFALTLVLTKVAISVMAKKGLVDKDLHKEKEVEVPNVGGIAIVFGFSVVLVAAYVLEGAFAYLLALLVFLAAASVGMLDDIHAFKPAQKLIFGCLAAVPLLMVVPWQVFPVVLLFAGMSVVSNWTNMLAGFNGMEIGVGAIALLFMAMHALSGEVSFVLLAYFAALLAFLFFNKYPAKIFPGDVGTFPIGAMLVFGWVFGVPLMILAILLIPHLLDALLKLFTAGVMSRQRFLPTNVENGLLIVPKESYLSLSRAILRIRPMQEWQLVAVVWLFEAALGIVTLLI